MNDKGFVKTISIITVTLSLSDIFNSICAFKETVQKCKTAQQLYR